MSDAEDVYDEVRAERAYQDEKWGHDADDRLNRPNDFVAYIAQHSTRWFPGGFAPYSLEELLRFRTQMVKTAAIAVAATEYVDRLASGENVREDVLRP